MEVASTDITLPLDSIPAYIQFSAIAGVAVKMATKDKSQGLIQFSNTRQP